MAIDLSKGFDEAQLLLNQVPMPRDIVEQLDRIRKTIPENELEMFDQLYDSIGGIEDEGYLILLVLMKKQEIQS